MAELKVEEEVARDGQGKTLVPSSSGGRRGGLDDFKSQFKGGLPSS